MSALSADRVRAIERSGWGEEFRLVQPHNLAFWVYCLLVAFGAVVLSGQVSIAAAAYSGALTIGIIAFGLLALAYVLYIHYEDRYTSVPPKLAGTGFVWGFVAATGAFALLGNEAVMSLYSKGSEPASPSTGVPPWLRQSTRSLPKGRASSCSSCSPHG